MLSSSNILTFHSGSPCNTLRFTGRFGLRLQAPEGGYQTCPGKVVHSYNVLIQLIEKSKISLNSNVTHQRQNPVEKKSVVFSKYPALSRNRR